MTNKYKQGDVVSAIFQPKDLETLRDAAKVFVGQRMDFRYLWIIDEDDTTNYSGQIAWAFPDDVIKQINAVWCPEEDLKDIKAVVLKLTDKA